jgi:dTDP-4-dehydrorhamnose 3,5-epimerase
MSEDYNLMAKISDIKCHNLKKISDHRGMVMHMLRSDAKHFSKFGEIYFSQIKKDAIKAWKIHSYMTQNIAVPIGEIKLVCYDNRFDSPSFGVVDEIYVGEENFILVTLPPNIWYGFQCISHIDALIVNCADMVHDPNEMQRKQENDLSIPYQWK